MPALTLAVALPNPPGAIESLPSPPHPTPLRTLGVEWRPGEMKIAYIPAVSWDGRFIALAAPRSNYARNYRIPPFSRKKVLNGVAPHPGHLPEGEGELANRRSVNLSPAGEKLRGLLAQAGVNGSLGLQAVLGGVAADVLGDLHAAKLRAAHAAKMGQLRTGRRQALVVKGAGPGRDPATG